ncbi:MAG: pyruvate ferredoxin oxidoreductase [Thermoplasmata archaeon]|nr:MAG: pyruvate ferredoxin oxidoreductase [Thermoplasmata archaeon]
MEEIRFHGRGGQGAVIGSEVLAHAFFIEGAYVQAFPAFGVERRGAPVLAFCRVDRMPIHLRSQIYEPDHVIVLDSSLLESVDVTKGLKAGGTVLINGKKELEHYFAAVGEEYRVSAVDAGSIAVEHHLGSSANPIVNTAILGAFSRVTGLVGIDAVAQAIEEYVPVKKEENMLAARDAYEKVLTKP